MTPFQELPSPHSHCSQHASHQGIVQMVLSGGGWKVPSGDHTFAEGGSGHWLPCTAAADERRTGVVEPAQEVHMRIIRRSDTSGRITEFVKEDRARVNIKVTPSLQYTNGIELRASIDDTTAAIVYLRLDDLRIIIDFIRHQGTVRQKELLVPPSAQPSPQLQGTVP